MKSTICSLVTLLLATSAVATPLHHQSHGSVAVRQASGNLQTFTGALGGEAAPPVTDSGDATRPFLIEGDTFVNLNGALGRSCDIQKNACAALANGGSNSTVTAVSDCDAQNAECHAAI